MISKSFSAVWISFTMATIACTVNAQEIRWNENVVGSHSFTESGPISIASTEPTFFESLSIRRVFENGRLGTLETIENVAIDGILDLDIQVVPEIILTGEAFDGTTTTRISFNGVRDVGEADFFGSYPQEGGNISLFPLNPTHLPYDYDGIEFNAEPGILTLGEDPSPFRDSLLNDIGNIVLFFSLGTPATIDGPFELDVFVEPNTPNGSITSPQPHFPDIPIFTTTNLEEFIAPTISCVIPADELVGDLDDNGTVEFGDFLILSNNFGLDVNTYREGDINCNGTVDFEDFLRLGNRFGQSRADAAQSVPEPTGGYLLIIGLVGVLSTRRKVSR